MTSLTQQLTAQPSVIKVGLTLTLASYLFYCILFVMQFVLGINIIGSTSISIISLLLPVFFTGRYIATKDGISLSPLKLCLALFISFIPSYIIIYFLLSYLDVSLYTVLYLIVSVDWFNASTLLSLIMLGVAFCIIGFAYKFGETIGINAFNEKQDEIENLKLKRKKQAIDKYKGACLCGGVTFSVDSFNETAANCHCSMCRKFHGAAFGTLVGVKGLNWLSGKGLLKHYVSENGVTRTFCDTCGSSLGFRSAGVLMSNIELAIATFDDDIPVRIDAQIYTNYKANWCQLQNDLSAYRNERHS